MKKTLLLFTFILPLITLSGCSFFISLFPPYMEEHSERLWSNKYTGQQLSGELLSSCFTQSIHADLMSKNLAIDDLWDRHSVYTGLAQCLHDHGYVFTLNIFNLYCYHDNNEDKCEIYKKYRR